LLDGSTTLSSTSTFLQPPSLPFALSLVTLLYPAILVPDVLLLPP
jgi:hypothetical protein